ncbi:hypothetical protein [Methylobacterium haplocladii]|uniref:Uncharacterized protein n=1 Tax=Methylobacterium haplocladii TaxID=1176176 RepID=A0A512IML5_9HYPH|nr:hypothetical protein [Methylobacterium haplocladii]GEO98956.1 hypothetical protein MHA02_13440 [Methylobacterium haplocladii]GJD84197.1 hypothetical protein HPGCJGGD_2072 [Methylobacterium haplocladii]GLS59814.1 hypothetical protein GCM10007887_24870 [Methylobacterium haplocladii]
MTEIKLDKMKTLAGGGGPCGRDKGGSAPAPTPAPTPSKGGKCS